MCEHVRPLLYRCYNAMVKINLVITHFLLHPKFKQMAYKLRVLAIIDATYRLIR